MSGDQFTLNDTNRAERPGPNGDVSSPPSSSSSFDEENVDWQTVCYGCKKKSFKKDECLHLVTSLETCELIGNAATQKNDTDLILAVNGDFSELIRIKAQYHSKCHLAYTYNYERNDQFTAAFKTFLVELLSVLEQQKYIAMSDALSMYRRHLAPITTESEALKYKACNLKERLQRVDEVTVFGVSNPRKPDIIVLNTKIVDILEDYMGNDELPRSTESDDDDVLFRAAGLLRKLVKNNEPVDLSDPTDISMDNCEKMVHEQLYSFIRNIVGPSKLFLNTHVPYRSMRENDRLHRVILSICQDLLFMSSGGIVHTPKHVGLTATLHQMTQSREIVELINHHGHGISYDTLQRYEAHWVATSQNDDVYIPTNIRPGRITTGAADNFNRAIKSDISRDTHDVVNMVLYQKSLAGDFGTRVVPPNDKKRKRRPDFNESTTDVIRCVNLRGKQPGPVYVEGSELLKNWFDGFTSDHTFQQLKDHAYKIVRMLPTKIFNLDLQVSDSQVPGWTVLRGYMSLRSSQQSTLTNIGFCPMLPSPASDPNTVYTAMVKFQEIFRALGQDWTFITYDEAIYAKAQMIKWRFPDEFRSDYLAMGGMHRAMNYMGDIGKVMAESGFEDILTEAKVYGSNTVGRITSGKEYNRGMRVHKLMNEAFSRLKWSEFIQWLEEGGHDIVEEHSETLLAAERCVKLLQQADGFSHAEFVREMDCLLEELPELMLKMDEFVADGKSASNTFHFSGKLYQYALPVATGLCVGD